MKQHNDLSLQRSRGINSTQSLKRQNPVQFNNKDTISSEI